jgi:hypothetical protein
MDSKRIEEEQRREEKETEAGVIEEMHYSRRPEDPGPFRLPLKSLESLKATSPSRKHGVSFEQEESWRRNCVDVIIKTGLKLQIDHVATITALEFLHRFYSEFSMVANDRFLVSMACLYLAGKVADCPKSSRDILLAGVSVIDKRSGAVEEKIKDKDWMDGARKQLVRAERALLYQTGFRFSKKTVPEALLVMLQDEKLYSFLKTTLQGDEMLANFSQLCIHLSNQSAKTTLALQYEPNAIAAACIWIVLKLLKVPDAVLRVPQPWYVSYGAKNGDLLDISNQIFDTLLHDARYSK